MVPVHELRVHALGLVAGLADLAGVVGDHERPHDEVAVPERLDLGADLLHHAAVLVTHHGVVDRLEPAVGPEVRPADAGRRQPDDGVARLDDPGVLAFLDADLAGGVHDDSTHSGGSPSVVFTWRGSPGGGPS
jgi:hypothetical protein